MKYVLQVRFNGAGVAINNLPAKEQAAVVAEFEAIRQLHGMLDGNQLQPASTATTFRVRDGRTEATDGPPVSPHTALDGYYL
jgi:hypothetical protein